MNASDSRSPPVGLRRYLAALPGSFRSRGLERRLLLFNLAPCLAGAWMLALGRGEPGQFGAFLWPLAAVWAAALALHVVLCLIRFDGDPLILPVFALLLLTGVLYQSGAPAGAGRFPVHSRDCLLGLAALGLVAAGGRLFKRLSVLFEERVWWKYAQDRPYYDSIPFHLALLLLMMGLALLLAVRGIRAEGGALIQVPLPFGLHFTPSEPIRLAVAFFLADFLGAHSRALQERRQPLGRAWPLNRLTIEPRTELVILLTTILLYCLFFYVFRDFGPAAVIIVLTLTMLYVATGRLLTPLLLGGSVALLIALPTYHDLAFHTLRNRVEMWLNPWDTDFIHGDHQARILWTIASGGWLGMGAGAEQLARALPLARNDCAFAGLAGMLGLWGGLSVLGLYALLAARGVQAARQAPTDRLRLLAFGLTLLLTFQAVWIAGAMVRLFPFTGINLPFLSTGLSSMLCSSVALGALWNLSRRSVADGTGHHDATDATEGVAEGVARVGRRLPAALAAPALGLLWFGCPWLGGDRTLVRTARAVDRARSRIDVVNPYLERFRRSIPRGNIYGASGAPLAESRHGAARAAPVRRYALGSAGAAFVGWAADREFLGMPGSVEREWDAVLRGYDYRRVPYYFRSRHNPLVARPQPRDLITTLEPALQERADQLLARAVRESGAAGGAILLYDAGSGRVLSAVSHPTVNPAELSVERMGELVVAPREEGVLLNRALSREAQFFPGSTFKLLVAAAALSAAGSGEAPTGYVTCRNGRNAEDVGWQQGGRLYRRPPGRISDFTRGGHGSLHLERHLDDGLAVSCNVFFAQLGARVGSERLLETLRGAELSWQPTRTELGEHLAEGAFGQVVVKASPLELTLLAAAAGAASPSTPDALAARPYWIESVLDGDRKATPPRARNGSPDTRPYRPFEPAVAVRLHAMMLGVVDRPDGTAHGAFYRHGRPLLPGIAVGGKTGTAEFDRPAQGSRRAGRGRHAWFTGFARNDAGQPPRVLAFTVFLQDVRRGVTGGAACAPVARDLVASVLPVAPAAGVDGEVRRPAPPQGWLGRLGSWLSRLLGGAR